MGKRSQLCTHMFVVLKVSRGNYFILTTVQIFCSHPGVLLLFVSRFAVVQCQIDSIATGRAVHILAHDNFVPRYRIFTDRWQWLSDKATRPDFFLSSSCIAIHLLSYDTKLTAIQEHCDWMAEKYLHGEKKYINSSLKESPKPTTATTLLIAYLERTFLVPIRGIWFSLCRMAA